MKLLCFIASTDFIAITESNSNDPTTTLPMMGIPVFTRSAATGACVGMFVGTGEAEGALVEAGGVGVFEADATRLFCFTLSLVESTLPGVMEGLPVTSACLLCGVGEGDTPGVEVKFADVLAVSVGDGVSVGVAVLVEVGVNVYVGVGVRVGVAVGVFVGTGVLVGSGVLDGTGVLVNDGVTVGVFVGVGVEDGVSVGSAVGVGLGATKSSAWTSELLTSPTLELAVTADGKE